MILISNNSVRIVMLKWIVCVYYDICCNSLCSRVLDFGMVWI